MLHVLDALNTIDSPTLVAIEPSTHPAPEVNQLLIVERAMSKAFHQKDIHS